jgi:hypothetical protein
MVDAVVTLHPTAKTTHTLADSAFPRDSGASQNGPLLAGPAKAPVTDSAILPGWPVCGGPVREIVQQYTLFYFIRANFCKYITKNRQS